MNYKITTIILATIVLMILVFKWNALFGNQNQNMHMMPDGSMMSNTGANMHSMMMDMTARMKGKTGDELDKVFLEDMIVHHQGAVDMAIELQKGTKRPELQKMATDIISVQTKEIEMMKKWLNEWFGTTK